MYAASKKSDGLVCEDKISLPKSIFQGIETLAAIDRGASLTKLVFISKNDWNKSESDYIFTCALFLNTKFNESLEYMAKNAHLENMRKMPITGMGGASFKNAIEKRFNMGTVFVTEFPGQCRGVTALVNALPNEKIFFPPEISTEFAQINLPEDIKKMLDESKSNAQMTKQNLPKFPALFLYAGSGGGIMKLKEDGSFEFAGLSGFHGKTMNGLCQLLLNTTDYDEIIALAEKGNRGNVDTQVWELLKDDENSLYGSFPPDLAMFSFGKADDQKLTLDKLNREDLAASLMNLVAMTTAFTVISMAPQMGIFRVIVGGNVFRGKIIRRFFDGALQMMRMSDVLDVQFLNTGHTGALGSILMQHSE